MPQGVESIERNKLREQQRKARVQLTSSKLKEISTTPLFGEPVKVVPSSNDHTASQVRKAFGEYENMRHILSITPVGTENTLIGVDLPPPTLLPLRNYHDPSDFNSDFKYSQPSSSLSSVPALSHSSNLSPSTKFKNIESQCDTIVLLTREDCQIRKESPAAESAIYDESVDYPKHSMNDVNLSSQIVSQTEDVQYPWIDLEYILKEMQCVTPVTALPSTPSRNSKGFTFQDPLLHKDTNCRSSKSKIPLDEPCSTIIDNENKHCKTSESSSSSTDDSSDSGSDSEDSSSGSSTHDEISSKNSDKVCQPSWELSSYLKHPREQNKETEVSELGKNINSIVSQNNHKWSILFLFKYLLHSDSQTLKCLSLLSPLGSETADDTLLETISVPKFQNVHESSSAPSGSHKDLNEAITSLDLMTFCKKRAAKLANQSHLSASSDDETLMNDKSQNSITLSQSSQNSDHSSVNCNVQNSCCTYLKEMQQLVDPTHPQGNLGQSKVKSKPFISSSDSESDVPLDNNKFKKNFFSSNVTPLSPLAPSCIVPKKSMLKKKDNVLNQYRHHCDLNSSDSEENVSLGSNISKHIGNGDDSKKNKNCALRLLFAKKCDTLDKTEKSVRRRSNTKLERKNLEQLKSIMKDKCNMSQTISSSLKAKTEPQHRPLKTDEQNSFEINEENKVFSSQTVNHVTSKANEEALKFTCHINLSLLSRLPRSCKKLDKPCISQESVEAKEKLHSKRKIISCKESDTVDCKRRKDSTVLVSSSNTHLKRRQDIALNVYKESETALFCDKENNSQKVNSKPDNSIHCQSVNSKLMQKTEKILDKNMPVIEQKEIEISALQHDLKIKKENLEIPVIKNNVMSPHMHSAQYVSECENSQESQDHVHSKCFTTYFELCHHNEKKETNTKDPQVFQTYLSEAKNLKHAADEEKDVIHQALKYLDAIVYFIQTGIAMECETAMSTTSAYRMYRETLNLIKYVSSRFRCCSTGNNNSVCDNTITGRLLAVLSLRCQSLLYMKLSQMDRIKLKDEQHILTDFLNKCQHGTQQSLKGMDSNSPVSPTPSPASSIGSVGSHSSGYSSGELQGGSSIPGGRSSPENTVITSYMDACVRLERQNRLLWSLHYCMELWEQGDALINRDPHKEECAVFFISLDQKCGPLTLHSSLNHLVYYVHYCLRNLEQRLKF